MLLRLALGSILAGYGLGRLLAEKAAGSLLGDLLLPGLCVLAGGLLLAGLFTFAVSLASGVALLVYHAQALAVVASKVNMWSTLVFTSAGAALVWLAPEDRLSLGWRLPLTGAARGAQRGPESAAWRLDTAVLLLRLALGADFIATGVSKLRYPWVESTVKQFGSTFLPAAAVRGFAVGLPYLQIVIGATLAVGLYTGASSFCLGLLLVVLLFGQIVIGASLISLWSILLYLLVVLAVLCLPATHRFSLDHLFARGVRGRLRGVAGVSGSRTLGSQRRRST